MPSASSPRFKNDAIASPTKQGMDFVGLVKHQPNLQGSRGHEFVGLGKVTIQVSTNAGGGVCDVGTECLLAKTDEKEEGRDAVLAEKKGLKEGRGTARYARGIDKLVYKLYGLTEEEIAIVEGKK